MKRVIATYRISFRVLPIASGQFLAEVSARLHRAGEPTQGDAHSESRLYSSLDVATLECRVMVAAMKGRLISAGHKVLEAAPPTA